MDQVFGIFILKMTGNGYQAKYINNHLQHWVEETINTGPGNVFVGQFRTLWNEGKRTINSNLTINADGNRFRLFWNPVREVNDILSCTFEGIGAINPFDDTELICNYWMN